MQYRCFLPDLAGFKTQSWQAHVRVACFALARPVYFVYGIPHSRWGMFSGACAQRASCMACASDFSQPHDYFGFFLVVLAFGAPAPNAASGLD